MNSPSWIRHMKHKKFFLSFILLMSVGFSFGKNIHADTGDPIGDLEPVQYEKLKFKQNTDYLHDEQKTEMKNTIPVKQFDINFDGSKQLPKKDDTSFVFHETERGKKSTVAAKTIEIGLFTKANNNEKAKVPIQANSQLTTGNTTRTMVFIVMIALGMIFLFTILLPRLMNQPGAVNSKFSKGLSEKG